MTWYLTHSNRIRAPFAAVVLAAFSVSVSMGQTVPGTAPGQRADQPQPGRPDTPAPDFAPPQPNRSAGPAQTAAGAPETPQIPVSAVVIKFEFEHPELPGPDDLQKTPVTLGRTIDGYVSPAPGLPSETFTIEEIALRPPAKYSFRALSRIMEAVRDEVNSRGVFGVVVDFSDKEFTREEDTKDLRRPGQTAFTMIVRAFQVKEIRTLAFGDRVPFERRINAEEHKAIRENAPVQVFGPEDPRRQDLLRKDLLDNYVFRLNRHPGRRVDIAVSAADSGQSDKVDGLAVDLMISENRPWFMYFQVSNTGTKQTNEWRERFGYVNNQLTDSDDILSLDYVTAGFDSSNALVASYERPVYGDWLRARLFGNWNQYTASDVGQTNEQFDGEGYAVGMEMTANIFQHRETFIDLTMGARYQHVETTNKAVGDIKGEGDFLLPGFGARLERITDRATTICSVGTEFNVSSVTDKNGNIDPVTGIPRFDQLGRTKADDEWVTLNWDLSHAFYLDPIFYGTSWNETDQSKGGHPSLAHELAVSFRGQYAFDKRLIPNFEQVLGGLFSVRGYPESIVAGDNVYVGSIEYRFHVPQAFGYGAESGTLFGKPFRYKPQTPYGRADWDLILKTFLDIGRVEVSSAPGITDEKDHTLIGTGVGAEFLFKRNFSLRVDWGVALKDVKSPDGSTEVSEGSNRFHILATILF